MKNTQANSDTQASFLNLSTIAQKNVHLSFDGADYSSDGGALLLCEVEKQLHLLDNMAAAISDERDQRYIKHKVYEMLLQRVSQIACGYEDANDCNTLRDDAIFKMIAGRLPESDEALASQPTQSRFENSITRRELYKLTEVFIENFINSYESEPDVIVLDFDDTADEVHGNQQLALFNGFYNEYCFMPLHIYEGLSGNLIATLLRPGKRMTGKQILSILKRLVNRLRQAWPDTIIIFRGDSHFASPHVFSWIEQQPNVSFVTGLSGNDILLNSIKHNLETAQKRYDDSGRNIKEFHSFSYQAGSWDKAQRVISKIEINEKGHNIRFITTDSENAKASVLYNEVYCARGKAELYIKEHKLGLKSDRTSCSSFLANQFRLYLHSAAYVLMHALRSNLLQGTQWARATFSTLRLRLFKIGAHVRELKTRIKIEFPTSCPVQNDLRRCFHIFSYLRSSA